MPVDMDRRVQPRFQPKPGCYIAYVEGSGGVRDLSLNGLFVLDEDPLPLGERIKFSLYSGDEEIPLDGIVVRSESNHGMAIQLASTSREGARRLQIHFSSLVAEPDRRAEHRVLVKIT
jgi:hypothetical protein